MGPHLVHWQVLAKGKAGAASKCQHFLPSRHPSSFFQTRIHDEAIGLEKCHEGRDSGFGVFSLLFGRSVGGLGSGSLRGALFFCLSAVRLFLFFFSRSVTIKSGVNNEKLIERNGTLFLGEELVGDGVGGEQASLLHVDGPLSFPLQPGRGDLGQLLGVVGVEDVLYGLSYERHHKGGASRTSWVVVERPRNSRGPCVDDVLGVGVEPRDHEMAVDGEKVPNE